MENRRETTGKTAGKPLGNRWESPVFGSLLPVSIRNWNGWKGSLRRHFSAPGGGCHKEGTFQAQLYVLFESDGVGGTGICGFLDVTKGILGPMTPKSEFHYKATPKGVYTSSDTPFRGGAYPLVVKENSHDLAITYVTFDPTPFWAFGPVSISPAGEVKKHVGR